jgi:hypothetical protein
MLAPIQFPVLEQLQLELLSFGTRQFSGSQHSAQRAARGTQPRFRLAK